MENKFNLLVEQYTRANGRTIKSMEMGDSLYPSIKSTKESTQTVTKMEEENNASKMVISLKDNTKTGNSKVKVYTHGLMDRVTKDSSKQA
jgi:hypothetical protein